MRLQIHRYAWKQVFCFLLIRILYSYVTVNTLDGLFYPGAGSYHIAYQVRKDVVSMIVFTLVILFYSLRPVGNDFKSVVLHLLLILYYIRVIAGYAVNDMKDSFFVLTTVYIVFMIFLFTCGKPGQQETDGKQRAGKEYLLRDNRVTLFCVMLCIVFILYKISYNGLSFTVSIDGDFVYANREAYNHNISVYTGSVAGYLLTLVSDLESLTAPVLLFISLRRRKIFLSFLALVTILAEFSLNSMKSTLFGILLVVALYYSYIRGWLKDYRKFFNLIFTGIMAVCVAERFFVRAGKIYILIVRRIMYAPAWLGWLYYDYFSQHPKVLLTDCVIGLQKILPHVYDSSPLERISVTYYDGTMASPNTGLFGAAYMQLGVAGIILQPVLIYFIVKWSEKALDGYGMGLKIVIAGNLVIKMQNVPVLRTDFVLSYVAVIFILDWLHRIKAGRYMRSQPAVPVPFHGK